LDAVCKYEPRPGSRRSRFPRTDISQTMRENQPPATDIIEFQIRLMAVSGSSSCTNFCHQLKRYSCAASSISRGILLSEEYTLKAMFQTCPVKIRKMDPSSTPNCVVGNWATMK